MPRNPKPEKVNGRPSVRDYLQARLAAADQAVEECRKGEEAAVRAGDRRELARCSGRVRYWKTALSVIRWLLRTAPKE